MAASEVPSFSLRSVLFYEGIDYERNDYTRLPLTPE